MRCLYLVCSGPLTPNLVGGSGIYYEQLVSLTEIGVEAHLLHWAFPTDRRRFESVVGADPDCWAEIQARCASVTLYELPDVPTIRERLANRVRNLAGPFPIAHPAWRLAARQLGAQAAVTEPDFIWAQHLTAARLALLHRRAPTVYSHHDWVHRVKALAANRAPDGRAEAAEVAVARRANAVVSGSSTDCDELRGLGCRNVAYIPLGYESGAPPQLDDPPGLLRLVHLGSMETSASRIGLERFLDVVWPQVESTGCNVAAWAVWRAPRSNPRFPGQPFDRASKQ